ncbi:EamA family transporter [Thioclava sp. L04-15]|uniref:DMT family transporter n=1 Tax=Thioclava sp. L04-15 TaxID=1915318 RepID=UPI00099779F0|nr:DMT family transporter [Thioclava sp. L04-15]OOY28827.1 EamA family transporter [Thioclava sp. L04-15]TNE92773.1 MAG: DMT family transporter [Paracoccaceae bacterium]
MREERTIFLASVITLLTGAFWGLYWLPVRALDARGLAGAWGTVGVTLAALVLLGPFAWRSRHEIAVTSPVALASIALGGGAFALYSIGFVYGRVAPVILLWFLTPVWSTLIGRFVMGWPTPRLRLYAIALGLAGLALILGAGGGLPLPRDLGEWMTLAGGVLWSISTTGIRATSRLSPAPSAFVFSLGAALASLILAPILAPLPSVVEALPATLALTLGTGAIWWGLSLAALMWATVRLEPARVGILLMTEVVVGAISAALLAHEMLSPMELAGGLLVLGAGVLELWPVKVTNPESRP